MSEARLALRGAPAAVPEAPPAPPSSPGHRSGARAAQALRTVLRHRSGALGLAVGLGFVLLALLAPAIAPGGPFEVTRGASRQVLRLTAPSAAHWFGTTNEGMDVFAQLVWGTRIALVVGLLSALGSVVLGTLVGLAAGYFGGWTDEVLMRATDVAFGIPFLPFAMVVISIARPSLTLVILLVIFFLWRTTARVIRAQVLSLKTRPFIWAAKAAGAGPLKILFVHIAPNVLPLSFLYVAIGVQAGIMLEAALSFLGFGDPHVLSWGGMLNAAFRAGAMRTAWWWVLPPSLALSLLVVCVFMVTRAFEEVLNPRLRQL